MLVRIRLGHGRPLGTRTGKNRSITLAAAALVAPVAVMSLLMALWRLGVDLSVTAGFAIDEGPFSHWHLWMMLAALLALVAFRLNRLGGPD